MNLLSIACKTDDVKSAVALLRRGQYAARVARAARAARLESPRASEHGWYYYQTYSDIDVRIIPFLSLFSPSECPTRRWY